MLLTFAMSLLFVSSPGDQSSPCDTLKVVSNLITWGHGNIGQPRRIEAIIVHSSYNALSSDSFSVDGILKEYRQINVAPHYIIDRSGTIYQLVPDCEVAYHAGKSRLPDGTKDVNRVSIGIEVINTENSSLTEEQYGSLASLVRCLEEKYPVKYLLGHSDIAPGRKMDPWNFDWRKLRSVLNIH